MPLRCAYCHEHAGDLVVCLSCQSWLHAGCWSEARTCPTLGCAAARPPTASTTRATAAPVLDLHPSCARLLVAAVVLLILAVRLCVWLGAPTVEVRNGTGRPLTNVHVRATQYEWGEDRAHADTLLPGDSLTVSGGDIDYELTLVHVSYDGAPVDDLTERLGHMGRLTMPFMRSVVAIDPHGELKTITSGTGVEAR